MGMGDMGMGDTVNGDMGVGHMGMGHMGMGHMGREILDCVISNSTLLNNNCGVKYHIHVLATQ